MHPTLLVTKDYKISALKQPCFDKLESINHSVSTSDSRPIRRITEKEEKSQAHLDSMKDA